MVVNWLFVKWTKTVTLSLKNKLLMRSIGKSSLSDSQKGGRWYHMVAIYLERKKKKIQKVLKKINHIYFTSLFLVQKLQWLPEAEMTLSSLFSLQRSLHMNAGKKEGQNWSGMSCFRTAFKIYLEQVHFWPPQSPLAKLATFITWVVVLDWFISLPILPFYT